MFTIDDEDDPVEALFNTVTSSGGASMGNSGRKPAEYSSKVDADMSWLDDDDSSAPPVVNHDGPSTPTVGAEHSAAAPEANAAVDDFLSEMFGEQKSSSADDTALFSSITNSNVAEDTGALAASASTPVASPSDPREELSSILASSFPDVERLRTLLLSEVRCIPSQLRGEVWCLLLTGHTARDYEDPAAAGWKVSSSFEVTDKEELMAHCQKVVTCASSFGRNSLSGDDDVLTYDNSAIVSDLTDVLALQCVRNGIDCSRFYADGGGSKAVGAVTVFSILYPLCSLYELQGTDGSAASRGLFSTCFHSLLAQYYPLVNLQNREREIALSTQCHWLRLLVSYHMPDLICKLDTLRPNWHRLRCRSGSASAGLICESWLVGYFCGSVPPAITCGLLDWSLLVRDNTSGVFLMATLLCLHADTLLGMSNAEDLEAWLDSIAAPSGDKMWFKQFHFAAPPNSDADETDAATVHPVSASTWAEFLSGWLHAAQSLRCGSPGSFLKAFDSLEEWSVRTALLGSAGESSYVTSSKGSNESECQEAARIKSTKALHSDDVCLWTSPEEVVPAMCGGSSRKSESKPLELVGAFLGGVEAFRGEQSSNDSATGSVDRTALFPVEPAENNWDKFLYFGVDCRSETQKLLGKFPKAYDLDCNMVLSTGSPAGASSGRGESMFELMSTLGPLSEYAHLCLFGAGDDRYCGVADRAAGLGATANTGNTSDTNSSNSLLTNQWMSSAAKLSQQVGAAVSAAAASNSMGSAAGILGLTSGSNQQLQQQKQEAQLQYTQEIDSLIPLVAKHFIQRHFRHVSILQGGFGGALRFMERADVPYTATSALVDSNKSHLQAFLSGEKTITGLCFPIEWNEFQTKEQQRLLQLNQQQRIKELQQQQQQRQSSSPPPPPTQAGDTLESAATSAAAAGTSSAGTAAATAANIGKRLSIFGTQSFDTLKKGALAISAEVEAKRAALALQQAQLAEKLAAEREQQEREFAARQQGQREQRQNNFTIDESTANNSGNNVLKKTEQEKQLALAMHTLAGLKEGDKITVSKKDLPAAVLFPALAYASVPLQAAQGVATKTDNSSNEIGAAGDFNTNLPDPSSPVRAVNTEEAPSSAATVSPSPTAAGAGTVVGQHRFLVVTPERFLVLDARGGGVGSEATVEANHHLTELIKITFRKKDPELVTIHFMASLGGLQAVADGAIPSASDDVSRQFRVVRRKEFVEALQKNMQRFR